MVSKKNARWPPSRYWTLCFDVARRTSMPASSISRSSRSESNGMASDRFVMSSMIGGSWVATSPVAIRAGPRRAKCPILRESAGNAISGQCLTFEFLRAWSTSQVSHKSYDAPHRQLGSRSPARHVRWGRPPVPAAVCGGLEGLDGVVRLYDDFANPAPIARNSECDSFTDGFVQWL